MNLDDLQKLLTWYRRANADHAVQVQFDLCVVLHLRRIITQDHSAIDWIRELYPEI